MSLSRSFSDFAGATARLTGRPATFAACVVVILLWAATGPVFRFSDTWQLIINTGTTIVTFLMVFLIQNTQNRDGAAIQTKLDELIRASAAQNFYIGIEHLTDDELEELRSKCEERARRTAVADKAEAAVQEKADRAADEAAG
jgi:low affinity Fe/Cu permease